jgi:hypothetical protein
MQFEIAQSKVENLSLWKHRIRLIEKAVYAVIAIFAFLIYRNPTMAHFAFIEYGMYSASGFLLVIAIFRYIRWYYDKQF